MGVIPTQHGSPLTIGLTGKLPSSPILEVLIDVPGRANAHSIGKGWMPRPWEMKDKFDLITPDFTYVRWLGDRKGIEEKTTTWDKVIVDRQGDLSEWVFSRRSKNGES